METDKEQIWRHTEIDRAMKKILRSLLATDDAWHLTTAAHAIADAVKDCGRDTANGVLHYLSADKALDEWLVSRRFANVCFNGGEMLFGIRGRSIDGNEHKQLLTEIASGCSRFLAYYDTKDGKPEKRKRQTVYVSVDDGDLLDNTHGTCGLQWSVVTKVGAGGLNYTVSHYRIEAFKRGSELLCAIVNFLYNGVDGVKVKDDIKEKLYDCYDWSEEIFGKVGEDGAVKV